MSETFQPGDPGRYQPQGSVSDPTPGSTSTGPTPGGPPPMGGPGRPYAGGPGGPNRVYRGSWGWSDRNAYPGLPFLGLFLVLLGGLLLIGELVPGFHVWGAALGVAAGLAYLIAWLTNHGRWGLYPGVILLSLSLPSFLIDLGLVQEAPGWTTLSLGIGLLLIALWRWYGGRGVGWQALVGVVLAFVGGGDVISTLVPHAPSLDALIGPLVVLGLGLLVIVRSTQRGRR
jgi:hypothetical protein